jgi:hypothetical protein
MTTIRRDRTASAFAVFAEVRGRVSNAAVI